jgi:hypothetical protein
MTDKYPSAAHGGGGSIVDVRRQVAGFGLAVGAVLAIESALFVFLHAPHGGKHLRTVARDAAAPAPPPEALLASADPARTRVALDMVCHRERAGTAAANARAVAAGVLLVTAACVAAVALLRRNAETWRTALAAVGLEVTLVVLGTAAVLLCFHGLAADWRYASVPEMVDDVARQYYAAVSSASAADHDDDHPRRR